MGACCSSSLSPEEEREIAQSKKYDELIDEKSKEESRVIKLLLLGTGESGKSTIFKQMQILHEKVAFNEIEIQNFRAVCRKNIIEAMQTLILGMQKFEEKFTNEKTESAAKQVMVIEPLQNEFWSAEYVDLVHILWKEEPAIRRVYANRAQLQLLDSAAYFFEHTDRIGDKDFRPTQEDILRARFRTSGIVEKTFIINDVPFKFLDVGGQRNERRKWLHCFEDVTAVIFVTAISEYDQMLFEDEKVNRLQESLRVFENIINNKFFKKSTIILFMNKIDLFIEKLKTTSIKCCFPEYDGSSSLEESSDFIERQFLSRSEDYASKDAKKRLIFPYYTCATDTSNVSKVFNACKATILDANLRRLGLG